MAYPVTHPPKEINPNRKKRQKQSLIKTQSQWFRYSNNCWEKGESIGSEMAGEGVLEVMDFVIVP